MKQNKSLSQLGMAMRAGKLITGDEIVLKAVRNKQVHLVILAGDASDNTKKSFVTNATPTEYNSPKHSTVSN